MTSKLTFLNIKHIIIKPASKITKNERSGGKLNARSIINRFSDGMKIDVFVLKNVPSIVCDEPLTVNEEDIRDDTRRQLTNLTERYRLNGRLPVHTDFFKQIKEDDTIVIILHEVETLIE